MDRSANQSRLSRAQLPPREVGSAALSLDQLTDLDQAINLSRGDRPAKSTPTPIVAHSAPKPIASPLSSPAANPSASKPAPVPKTAPKPAEKSIEAPEPPVVPVRSAKEAINAMYSSENPARLSDYLGASAKEIINATHSSSEGRDAKSASSLHHASSQRKIEAARPSASAIFRAAKSEKSAPVVHTSLELDPHSPKISKPAPKQTPIIINSRTRAENSRLEAARPVQVSSVRPKKGQIKITTPSPTSIAVSAIEDAVASASPKAAKISKPSASVKSPKTSVPKPAQTAASPRRRGVVDGFARPARNSNNAAAVTAAPVAAAFSVTSAAASAQNPIKNRSPKLSKSTSAKSSNTKPGNDPYQKLPTDSVKRRFRLAPKGFAANKPEQARPARRKFMSFSNPDYSVPIPKPTPAVEIYGMTEPDPVPERGKDGLGIVEDYRPENPANPAMNTSANNDAAIHAEQSAAQASRADKATSADSRTPDNNRYALGGQSPFFLKSVSVEKRPLSDAPTRRADTISPIYTDPGDEVPRKNVYDGKSGSKSAKSQSAKAKKSNPRDLPQRPTVIIPSSRRSHTPLFLLLILTVILGAAVGAAVYFFFFQ